jgi:hypothetical protein
MAGSAPARVYSANVMHEIRGRIKFDTANAATGIELGTLPAGSFVDGVTVHVITAFNAGTTNVLVVGTAADDDGFATSAGIAAGTAGKKNSLDGAQSGDSLTADTPVVAKFTQTGTAATTGEASILLKYAPHVT